MLLDTWKEFSEEEIIERGFGEEFYPFSWRLDYDEVENSPSSSDLISYIGTSGVGIHTDTMFPKFSYHLVLRNKRLIAKGSKQNRRKIPPQTPGTIIVLDIWKLHHVTWDKRLKEQAEPLWISACFDSGILLAREEVSLIFKEFLES